MAFQIATKDPAPEDPIQLSSDEEVIDLGSDEEEADGEGLKTQAAFLDKSEGPSVTSWKF